MIKRKQSILSTAVFMAVSLLLGAMPVGTIADEPPAQVEKSYQVRQGDTLRSVATLLYGHKNWWPEPEQLNPSLEKLNPDAPIPQNQVIRYLGPEIGDEYVVKPGDWLVRIAEWKYGSNSQWESIFRANIHAIKSPDLIHPGDRLSFSTGGSIVNLETGKQLVNGVERQPAAQPEAPAVVQTEVQPLAQPTTQAAIQPALSIQVPAAVPIPDPVPPQSFGHALGLLFLGLAAGVFLLAVLFLSRSLFLKNRGMAPLKQSPPPAEPAFEPTQLRPISSAADLKNPNGYPVGQKGHTPTQENLLAAGNPANLDRRPGFDSITPNRRKKYMG